MYLGPWACNYDFEVGWTRQYCENIIWRTVKSQNIVFASLQDTESQRYYQTYQRFHVNPTLCSVEKNPSPGEEIGPSAAWKIPENLTWLEPSEGLPLMAEVMMQPLSDMVTVDSSGVGQSMWVGSFPLKLRLMILLHDFVFAASSTGLWCQILSLQSDCCHVMVAVRPGHGYAALILYLNVVVVVVVVVVALES